MDQERKRGGVGDGGVGGVVKWDVCLFLISFCFVLVVGGTWEYVCVYVCVDGVCVGCLCGLAVCVCS